MEVQVVEQQSNEFKSNNNSSTNTSESPYFITYSVNLYGLNGWNVRCIVWKKFFYRFLSQSVLSSFFSPIFTNIWTIKIVHADASDLIWDSIFIKFNRNFSSFVVCTYFLWIFISCRNSTCAQTLWLSIAGCSSFNLLDEFHRKELGIQLEKIESALDKD